MREEWVASCVKILKRCCICVLLQSDLLQMNEAQNRVLAHEIDGFKAEAARQQKQIQARLPCCRLACTINSIA